MVEATLVGHGDHAVPARKAFGNVGRALAAAHARPNQVTRITIRVVNYRHEYPPAIEHGRVALFGDHQPTDTLLGVDTLAHPGCLIEIDAIAVVEDPWRSSVGSSPKRARPCGGSSHTESGNLTERRRYGPAR